MGQEHIEIQEQIMSEIAVLGETLNGIKKEHNELLTNYEQLKKEVELNSQDYIKKEKLDKLSVDVTTRQDGLDKLYSEQKAKEIEFKKRIDAIEVAIQRPGQGFGKGTDSEIEKKARLFMDSIDSMKGAGASYRNRSKVNIETYTNYDSHFEKYMRLGDRFLDDNETKAMLVGSDPDGGYLVTPAMSSMIISRMFEIDPIRSLAASETISTDAIEWLVDYDEAGVAWESETVSTTETTTPNISKKRIVVHPLGARPKVTNQLLEDASINIENWLSNKVSERFARFESAAFVTGDGIGKPRGFLTYADGSDGDNTAIERVNMGAAAALTADGFIDVKYHMLEQYLNRGTWLARRSTVAAATKLKTGDGDYIWKPGLASDSQSTILGLPVRMSPTVPAVAAAALAVVLADWKEAYMVVDRLGITVLRDPYTAKPYVELYFRKRVGGDVINTQAIKIGVISA